MWALRVFPQASSMTPPRRSRADDLGTALTEMLPWLRSIDELAGAAQRSLDRTDDDEMTRALEKYHDSALAFLGEDDEH